MADLLGDDAPRIALDHLRGCDRAADRPPSASTREPAAQAGSRS
ncbi:hypothetical protein TI01_1157 [Lysobacter sp. A03]|nr:hypothetical protein TI01_1157 [Lysobacter sp. A03]